MFAPEKLELAVCDIAAQLEPLVVASRRRRSCERKLWHELSLCILSSQVNYDVALRFADRLDRTGLLWRVSPSTRCTRTRLESILSEAVTMNRRKVHYRFPKSRSSQIFAAWRLLTRGDRALLLFVDSFPNSTLLRKALVEEVPGLGPKQASMFIRNIGRGFNLAVIDRHVSRFMDLIGIRKEDPTLPARLARYVDIEKDLQRYADKLDIEVGKLDWAIWIVMRAASQMEPR
jgi:N-glycosylase/DNA lyase